MLAFPIISIGTRSGVSSLRLMITRSRWVSGLMLFSFVYGFDKRDFVTHQLRMVTLSQSLIPIVAVGQVHTDNDRRLQPPGSHAPGSSSADRLDDRRSDDGGGGGD